MEGTVMASDDRDIERQLSQTEPPRLVAGVHRERLREDLLRRMHEASPNREVCPATAWKWWVMNGYRSGSVVSRLAWACGAVILLGAATWGSTQVAKKVRKVFVVDTGKVPPPITRTVKSPDGTTTTSGLYTGEFLASDDPNMTAEKARAEVEEVDRLVAEGKATEVRREEEPLGTRVFLKVKRADGTVMNTSRLEPATPEARERRATMFLEAITAGKMDFVRKVIGPDGTTIYEYRVKLADGTTVTHLDSLPIHDKALAQRHRDEIERARAAHAGTFLQTLELPGQQKTNVYQVRLSDGDVAIYLDPEPLPAKPSTGK
jgi:hypothetical protein